MCVSTGPSEGRTKLEVQNDEREGQKDQEVLTSVEGDGEGRKEVWRKISLQWEDFGCASGQSESRECLLEVLHGTDGLVLVSLQAQLLTWSSLGRVWPWHEHLRGSQKFSNYLCSSQ